MEDLKPRHIEKDEAKRLGIKPGWYGAKVSGTLVTAPASTREECTAQIIKLAKRAEPAPPKRRAR